MTIEIMWIIITSIVCLTTIASISIHSGIKYGHKYNKLYKGFHKDCCHDDHKTSHDEVN